MCSVSNNCVTQSLTYLSLGPALGGWRPLTGGDLGLALGGWQSLAFVYEIHRVLAIWDSPWEAGSPSPSSTRSTGFWRS